MSRVLSLACATFTFASASAASAQYMYSSRTAELATRWHVEHSPAPAGVRDLAAKELVLKQRLLPSGLIELERALTKAEAGADVAQGTQLIEISSPGRIVFCEGAIARGAQTCLADTDLDGRLDASFQYRSQTPALVMITGRMPKKLRPLSAPIAYTRIDPASSTLGAFVAIERRNWFNIYSLEGFTILYGSGSQQARITSPVQFKSSEMPKELTVLGARFTALGEKDGRMSIRVDESMPEQVLGVTRTVSYR